MHNLMTREEYAKHRGVSPQAISKLIGARRIPFQQQGRRVFIDPAEADFALGESRQRVNMTDDEPDEGPGPIGAPLPAASSGLTKARTATEIYKAKIAELEYRERVGRLVPIETVRGAMERCAEVIVRDIDQLPTFADDLASALARNGTAGLRGALKGKARELRERLAASMTLLAAADETDEDSD